MQVISKVCTKCGVEKGCTKEHWYMTKQGKAVQPCKPCRRASEFVRYRENLDRNRQRSRQYAADCRKRNPEKQRKSSRAHYQRNRESEIERNRIYKSENYEEIKRRRKESRLARLEECRARDREKYHRLRAQNPEGYEQSKARKRELRKEKPEVYRKHDMKKRSTPRGLLNDRVASAISASLRRRGLNKTQSKVLLTGWTIEQLRQHLEPLFEDGMGWHNYKEWHIDHIIPLSSVAYENEHDPLFKMVWALDNLAPLWAKDNLEKLASLKWQLPDTYKNPKMRALYEDRMGFLTVFG